MKQQSLIRTAGVAVGVIVLVVGFAWVISSIVPRSHLIKAQATQFQIVSPTGEVYLSPDDIQSYDWVTHTLMLKPGVVAQLRSRLQGGLVSGIPFVVEVDNVECYRGVFTTSFSSQSQRGPCIVFDSVHRDIAKLDSDLSVQMHYTGSHIPTATDPPTDERVRVALQHLGKLNAQR
jgi:hypothetical protein